MLSRMQLRFLPRIQFRMQLQILQLKQMDLLTLNHKPIYMVYESITNPTKKLFQDLKFHRDQIFF